MVKFKGGLGGVKKLRLSNRLKGMRKVKMPKYKKARPSARDKRTLLGGKSY